MSIVLSRQARIDLIDIFDVRPYDLVLRKATEWREVTARELALHR